MKSVSEPQEGKRMRSKARKMGAALLMTSALLAASPTLAQDTPAEGSDETAARASQQSDDQLAEDKDGALPARVTTGYPARALRYGLTGTVGLTVTVTPEGRATECVVTQSSGHAELDHAACQEIQEKARFEPALDADGQPTSAQFSTKITFRIN